MSRRYWTLLLDDQPGGERWVVVAESLSRPQEAVLIHDWFPSQQAAWDYVLEVTKRQFDVAGVDQ